MRRSLVAWVAFLLLVAACAALSAPVPSLTAAGGSGLSMRQFLEDR